MVFILALGASLANALTSVFQRMGVENAPAETTLKLSLMTYAIRRGIWLLGFALMIVSFVLQAIALHFGRLSQVQPILTLELVFLVDRALGLVRASRSVDASGSAPWPRSAASPASCTAPIPRRGTCRRPFGVG